MTDDDDDDDRVMLEPEEIMALPVMLDLKRAMRAALGELDTEWMVRFLRNFADKLEAEMQEVEQ